MGVLFKGESGAVGEVCAGGWPLSPHDNYDALD